MPTRTIAVQCLLQRSRCVFAAEGTRSRSSSMRPNTLQRSRCVFAAEGALLRDDDERNALASTKPLRVRSGRVTATASSSSWRTMLQRSRCVFAAEGTCAAACGHQAPPASTKPLRVRSGRVEVAHLLATFVRASTKPLRVRSGRERAMGDDVHGVSASTKPLRVRSGRGVTLRVGGEVGGASTKPLRVRSGRASIACTHGRSEYWLQRSRCVFAAEGLDGRRRSFFHPLLQRSRCVFAAEGFPEAKPRLRMIRFNEAAACSQRKAFQADPIDAASRPGFNEAAACSQRKAATKSNERYTIERFNEAAACSQRKEPYAIKAQIECLSFNEAAACSQRKEELLNATSEGSYASTKPLRVRSGRASTAFSLPGQTSSLQRSRCVFAAEGPVRRPVGTPVALRFNEAAACSQRKVTGRFRPPTLAT